MSVPVDNLLSSASRKRALIAGSVGNFIEWYEFAVYGFLATVIAQNFPAGRGVSADRASADLCVIRHRLFLPSTRCNHFRPDG